MKITIPYDYLSTLINQKYKLDTTITNVNRNTIAIRIKPALLIPSVYICVSVEKDDNEFVFNYSSGAVAVLAKVVNLFIKNKLPPFLYLSTSNQIILLDSKFIHEGIEVEIKNISFLKERISIS